VRRMLFLTGVVFILALSLAACGAETPTTSLSLAVAPGDEICQTAELGFWWTNDFSVSVKSIDIPAFLSLGKTDFEPVEGHCNCHPSAGCTCLVGLTFCLSASASAPPGTYGVDVVYEVGRPFYYISEEKGHKRALHLTVSVTTV